MAFQAARTVFGSVESDRSFYKHPTCRFQEAFLHRRHAFGEGCQWLGVRSQPAEWIPASLSAGRLAREQQDFWNAHLPRRLFDCGDWREGRVVVHLESRA